MKSLKGYTKFLVCLSVIGFYFILTMPALLVINIWPVKTKKYLANTVSFCSRLILFFLGVRVEVTGELDQEKSYFIVANHMSYIDIILISRYLPTLFVTSIEMKKTPVLGQITQLAGCLFVERRSRKNIFNEIEQIQKTLESGIGVTVFPEATSSNGEALLPFKRSLFEAAAKSGKEILPITINYNTVNGEVLSTKNRDLLCWYGDMEFAPHLLRLCMQSKISLSIHFGEKIETKSESDTVILRDIAFEVINSKYRGLSDLQASQN